MLNIFPIQFLSLFAYFILRLFIGGILMYLGIKHFAYRKELQHILRLSWFPYGTFVALVFPIGEIIIASMILFGAYTQIAVLAIMAMSIKMIIMRNWFAHHSIPSKLFYVLLLGGAISLFITGAGVFAFDLPL